ncbi:S-layer homology domain-containing protein [Sporosarcina sp. FSL K6-1522]|uniref:S-layer homology domain-containing protein n=1 Tax=Sporosarcina sp. FSL K6-1522 TaxID=2921554 RepID=UPI003159EA3B
METLHKQLIKSFSIMMSLLLVFSIVVPTVQATDTEEREESNLLIEASESTSLDTMIQDTVRYYQSTTTNLVSWWEMVALWGAGENLANGSWSLPSWQTKDPGLKEDTFDTEHIRYIFGLLAMGKNPSQAWETERNLYAELAAQQQEDGSIGGMNKHAWAMLALDAGEKLGHDTGTWDKSKKQQALKYVLDSQKDDGGFALFGTESDTDITGMVLLALGNYRGDSAADAAIERAKAYLKLRQLDLENGGFNSAGRFGMGDNANSLSTSVSGLVAVGENLLVEKWTVNGNTIVDAYKGFQLENGGFKWKHDDAKVNGMATEQALIALTDIQTGKSVWQRIAEPRVEEKPDGENAVQLAIQSASELMIQKGVVSEWQAIGLARAGIEVPASYNNYFKENLNSQVITKVGSGRLKITDVERLAIAAAALGLDARNVDGQGFSLIDKIHTSEHWTWENTDSILYQGNNGIIFALIALDSKAFAVPEDAKWTRDKLVAELLKNQKTDGSWSLQASTSGSTSIDITAMALTALAPYHHKSDVKNAIDKAAAFISTAQGPTGGFNEVFVGGISSEATSQVIIGLTANNIDPRGERFTKNGTDLIDHLLSFKADDGGFKHIMDEKTSNGMANEQALQALVAFDLFTKGEGRLYDFGKEVQPDPETGVMPVPPGEPFELNDSFQPDTSKPVILAFAGNNEQSLPKVTAERGKAKLEIPAGTQVTSTDWDGKIQAPTTLATSESVKATIDAKLGDRKIAKMGSHIKVGGAKPIHFNDYVTLTLSGYGANEAGLINTSGTFELIKKYSTKAEAASATQDVYAYPEGNDLIIKTKHFTEFLTFETEAVEPENPGTGGGGETTPPATKTVTLSVEKRTMDGTDIIKAMDVSLQSGDTAFTLLKRVVGEKGISIDYIGNGATLYVQAIDGLGEFDGGPDSGWMYSVNGIYPNFSAGLYTLQDGDVLRWRYTKDLGHDIGGGYVPEGGNPGGGGSTNPEPNPDEGEILVPSDKPFVLDQAYQNDATVPVTANFGEQTVLPQVTAPRGNTLLEVGQGTKVTSDWDGKLQLPTSLSTTGFDLQQINKVLGLNGLTVSALDFRLKVGGAKTITFDQHVTLTLKGRGDMEVGFIDDKGNFKLIKKYPSAIRATDNEYAYPSGKDLIIQTNHFTEFVTFKPTVIDKPIEFTDVGNNWAKEFIEKAAQTGVIKGYPDGTFRPNNTITRAQAASIVVRGLGLTTDKSAPFQDIIGYDKETQQEIAAAYQHGIVIGQQGKFNPGNEVTRSQLALMLHRAYTQKTGKEYVTKQTAPYPDIGGYDEETVNAISMLYELEIATGSDGKYKPAAATTRAQAAKMFVNFFEHLER